jgi:hypothetical protein
MQRILALALLIGSLSAHSAEVQREMGECEMAAMRQFGSLRKPHPVSGILWLTTLDLEYRESCMKARGYSLDWDLASKDNMIKIHGIRPEALWPWDAKYWKPPVK